MTRRPEFDTTPVWATVEILERSAGAVRLSPADPEGNGGWVNISHALRPEDRDALRDAPPGVPLTVQLWRFTAECAGLAWTEVAP